MCSGTVAWYLGKKGGEGSATHRWTVYCRGPNNEDLSYIIRRVTFDLHETFATPKRHIDHQPFEVTEMGWGEFDVGVTLHFTMDSRESEVTIFHRL
jgi:YEATS domain-containing protein 4